MIDDIIVSEFEDREVEVRRWIKALLKYLYKILELKRGFGSF